MDQQTHVYIFGDEAFDYSAGLRSLLARSRDPLLASFFDGAFSAIRGEVGKLSQALRAQFDRFSSLQDLIALRNESLLHPALEQALNCVYQLGCFIRKCEINGGVYPMSEDSCLIGLHNGALTAAAVSSCRTLFELLPAAIHTVIVAFRVGCCAVKVGKTVHQHCGSSVASWSMVVDGLTLEAASKIVRDFSHRVRLPLTSRPWVSVTSRQNVTISGPPAVLASLRESLELSKSEVMHIPIWAPYHAPHLFSEHDVEVILQATPAKAWSGHTANLKVVLGASGNLTWAGNFRTLLQAAVKSILCEPWRMDITTKGVASILSSSGVSPVILYPIATTAEQALLVDLGKSRHIVVVSEDPHTTKPFTENSSKCTTPAANAASTHRLDQSKIAIIGMSGRFPESEDPDAFWKLLSEGLDVHKVVPSQHWDARTHVDLSGEKKNTSATPYGCWLKHPGLFDSKFFNMSPREAPQVDPAQRIALMTAYEAIEKAGIVPGATPSTQRDRVGVFYGVTSNDWLETNSAQNIDTYFIPGGNRAFIPGRINYFFKFSGPSYSIDTACSSSLAAIHVACNSLWKGDVDTAIAGGTNVLTNPDFTAGLDRGHFLSRTGNCKTFDESADGYCRGEGVGTVILKRLGDAITDNDPIQGLILGAYTNHSAEAESITRPHVGAQKAMFSRILNSAGIDPSEVSYVEMHGTGTQAGDAGEMQSVLETFAPADARRKRRDDQALYIGSAKANIGHGEAASGVSSLVKVLMMMAKDLIPPHCGIKTEINRRFPTNLDERRVFIAKKLTKWPRPVRGTRKVFINNFSAAGGNSALLLEDAPSDPPKDGSNETDSRSVHLVAMSAKSATSLRRNLKSLVAYLEDGQLHDCQLPALSYTTTARRIHHAHRVIVSGASLKTIKSKLQKSIDSDDGAMRPKSAPKIAFAFTGQGSQYPGMGKQLLDSFSSFRSDIYRFDHLAQSQGYPSFLPVLSAEGGEIADFTPLVVQVATVCLEMALARLWVSWGITPHCVIGHSLGEYAALNAAGVFSESDTIYLVGKRAQLLQDRCSRGTHSMLAVRASTSAIESILRGTIPTYEIACINGPDDVVLSGESSKIMAVQKSLAAQQIKATLLKVPYAFHSSQVKPVLEGFQADAIGVTFYKPKIPVLCPLESSVVNDSQTFGPKYLSNHCRQPVNILGAVNAAKALGIVTEKSFAIEIGPQPVVSGMLKAILGSQVTALPSLQRNKDTWPLLTAALSTIYAAGGDIAWREYHHDFRSSHKVLQLPAYGWDLKDYWIQYVNDWSLRKGDNISIIENDSKHIEKPNSKPISKPSTKVAVPKLESTTVHNIFEEIVNSEGGTLIIESDIARADLNPLVQGHKVDGIPLCTPSVYADIGLQLGRYLLDRYQPSKKERLVDVSEMTITKALIARPSGPQVLRTTVELDWTKNHALCRFLSVNDSGKVTADHAHCTIRFTDASKLQTLQRGAPETRSRMADLEKGLATGKSYRFNKPMIYKMITALADFDPNYRALNQIILDSDAMEASSIVGFADINKGGNFHTHPAYIDGLSQVGGFVMNANERSDLNVELQGVSRRLLGYILSSESGVKISNKQPPKAMPAASPLNKPNRTITKAPLALPTPTTAASAPIEQVKAPKSGIGGPAIIPADPQARKTILTALEIISEESGIAVEELTDGSVFSDIGVDSLLALLIVSRFTDELGIEIESSDFYDLQTVKDLKGFLSPAGVQESTKETLIGKPIESKPQDISALPIRGTANVPITQSSCTPLLELNHVPSTEQPQTHGSENADIDRALQIIAEESGVAVAELSNQCTFSDMGVDSLLSLIIVGRFSDELGVRVISESSLFTDYPTVGDLKLCLASGTHAPEDESSSINSSGHQSSSSVSELPDRTPPTDTIKSQPDPPANASPLSSTTNQSAAPPRPASSIVLQGRPKTARATLFLFPDGSGSGSSYTNLPPLPSSLALIGLNCPYRLHPAEMSSVSLDTLITAYVSELRGRQPSGPYHLGGWSAGGILAYRATQQLICEGEEVHSLVLIDSPVPRGLDRLPQRFYDHCNTIGLFGKLGKPTASATPDWLIPHFNGTIDILHDYVADPLPEGETPATSILWATECVLDGIKFPTLPPGNDETEGLKFLTEKRVDFSAGGWEGLFPDEDVRVEKGVGADHFSLMSEHGRILADFIDRAVK